MKFNFNTDIFNNRRNTINPKGKRTTQSAFITSLVTTLVIAGITEYLFLIPIRLLSLPFLIFSIILLAIFTMLNSIFSATFNRISKITSMLIGVIVVIIVIASISGSSLFRASDFHNLLKINTEANFYEDFKQISYDNIPLVDHDTAARLGDRKLGSMMEYVSQFDIDSEYTQINVDGRPYRITPVGYSGLVKWFNNKDQGLPCYIKVDMITQEAEVIRLSSGMKYSNTDLFNRNIRRHLFLNYPTFMFDSVNFEINDEGRPYWVASVYEYTIGIFNGKDVVGAVLVDAIDGTHKYYDLKDIPTWVDRVFSAEMVLSQLNNWGKYNDGFWNTIFGQKGVLQTTEGYSYLAMDDDVYLYTGLTSVLADESNVGFALVNLRTKEANFYNIPGAEEFSAMDSAQGQVQHLGYVATFPLLINVADEPTYFISLKDNAGLVKKYAFVSVENYQIVGVGDTVALAQLEYNKALINSGKTPTIGSDLKTIKGVIRDIQTAVVEGNSNYYFTLDNGNTVYIAPISLSSQLPLLSVGTTVEIEFLDTQSDTIIINQIVIK